MSTRIVVEKKEKTYHFYMEDGVSIGCMLIPNDQADSKWIQAEQANKLYRRFELQEMKKRLKKDGLTLLRYNNDNNTMDGGKRTYTVKGEDLTPEKICEIFYNNNIMLGEYYGGVGLYWRDAGWIRISPNGKIAYIVQRFGYDI